MEDAEMLLTALTGCIDLVTCFQCKLTCMLVCYKGVELKQPNGRGEGSHPAAYVAVKAKLINNLRDNLHKRFPQVELMDAMKVRHIDRIIMNLQLVKFVVAGCCLHAV